MLIAGPVNGAREWRHTAVTNARLESWHQCCRQRQQSDVDGDFASDLTTRDKQGNRGCRRTIFVEPAKPAKLGQVTVLKKEAPAPEVLAPAQVEEVSTQAPASCLDAAVDVPIVSATLC